MWPQVVGHTIQRSGINSACEARVHRIDVGMSVGCGDKAPQVRASLLSLDRPVTVSCACGMSSNSGCPAMSLQAITVV